MSKISKLLAKIHYALLSNISHSKVWLIANVYSLETWRISVLRDSVGYQKKSESETKEKPWVIKYGIFLSAFTVKLTPDPVESLKINYEGDHIAFRT